MSTTTEVEDPTMIQSPLAHLSAEQIEAIGEEFQKLHDEVFADLGDRDARYIRGIIDLQRRIVLLGRALLLAGRFPPTWILGTSALSLAKILENMEIGHNVMHGQWDWMNDPVINSQSWDWDTASTKESWKHSHNYIHHTYTNIRGLDKDLGYEIMRVDPHQPWNPVYLLQPFYNLLLMFLFEWGVALHDLDLEAVRKGEKPIKDVLQELRGISGKMGLQVKKDYIAWPVLSAGVGALVALARGPRPVDVGKLNPNRSKRDKAKRKAQDALATAKRRSPRRPSLDVGRLKPRRSRADKVRGALASARSKAKGIESGPWGHVVAGARSAYMSTLVADVIANIVRNVWAHSIIFCGHFPDQTYTFSPEEVKDETLGATYIRQLVGAANIDGGPMFHIISGNLGYQVEHHLYPDMPSSRYGEIAPQVRDICQRYGLPYNTGPFSQQLWMVHRTIARLALPGGKPRAKPGPYTGPEHRAKGEGAPESSSNGASRNGHSS